LLLFPGFQLAIWKPTSLSSSLSPTSHPWFHPEFHGSFGHAVELGGTCPLQAGMPLPEKV
jgi:hypothetical protein